MSRRPFITVFCALLFALVNGCSDAMIPLAEIPPPTVPSASYSASFTFQPGPRREFGSVPAGGWYNVSFRGTITLTTHPGLVSQCITYEAYWGRPWTCPLPLDGAQVGPEGVVRCAKTGTDCGRVMYIREICAHGGSCTAPYHPLEYRPTGSLIFVHRGFPVQVDSRGESESWADHSGVYPAYIMSGEYSMQIETAASPFTVTLDASAGLGGDSVRFTTDVTEPWEWVFLVGDTAAEPLTPPELEYEEARIIRCNYRPSCDFAPASGGRMYVHGRMANGSVGWAAGPPVGSQSTPVLSVACTPVPLVRGSEVRCTASVSPPADMVITRQSARGAGFSFTEQPNVTVPQDSVYVWSGTAVASTRVEMRARVVQGGTTYQLRDDDSFAVTVRTWTPYQLTSTPPHTIGLRGTMQAYPANGVVGNFGLHGLNPFSTPVDSVNSGPNTGLSYLRTQPPYIGRGADVYTHPVLYPPPAGAAWAPPYTQWYNDQNGVPGGTCNQSHVAQLRVEAERHEGLTQAPNSHYGIANDAFRTDRPDRTLEALYRFRVTNERLYHDAYNTYRQFIVGPQQAKQAAFDNADYPLIQASLGCLFDNNPSNP